MGQSQKNLHDLMGDDLGKLLNKFYIQSDESVILEIVLCIKLLLKSVSSHNLYVSELK